MKAEVCAEYRVSSRGLVSTSLFSNPLISNLHSLFQRGLEEAARLFGRILEREINVRQMLHLVHAQLAFSALVLLGGISALVAVLLMAWFVLSVIQCVRAL